MTAKNEESLKLASNGERAVATRLGDLITGSQLVVIRKICAELNVNINEVSQTLFDASFFCLSKAAANDLIHYLESSDQEGRIKKARVLQFRQKIYETGRLFYRGTTKNKDNGG